MSVGSIFNPTPVPLLLLLRSARSLSLSHRTRAHLAQPCGLNWIRHTRLFRYCALAWESPSHLHEGRRKERDRQHLSVDLRAVDAQEWKGCREPEDHQSPVVPQLGAKWRVGFVQGGSLHLTLKFSWHSENYETLFIFCLHFLEKLPATYYSVTWDSYHICK